MRTLPTRVLRATALLLLAPLCSQELALQGLDPIALAAGAEQAGREDLTLERGRFRYRFATAANLATFRAEPERHEIRFGGACARMGPLSGGGDPARWWVHDGRIFVFASDACREGFRKRPDRFLDADVPKPDPDPAGEELLRRAVAAHGGADRLRAWRSYGHDRRRTEGDTQEQWRDELAFPARFRRDHTYRQGEREWRFADVVTDTAAFQLVGDAATPMHPSARRESERQWLREPVVALRLALERDHVATARGKVMVGELAVETFDLWLDGAVVTFGLDATGRVRTLTTRARGPQLWFGTLVRTFDDLVEHDGILLPHRLRVTFDGQPAPALDEVREHVTVDAPVDDERFQPPR